MKVIASYSIKGGVGKTATSVNLAYGLAAAGMRTLLVDLDPQGASSFYFRVRGTRGLRPEKFFRGRRKLLQYVRGSDFDRLDVLPAKLSYRKFDRVLNRMKNSKRLLAKVVRAFSEEYDVVFLDSPAGISMLSENILDAADLVLVPVIPTTLSKRTYGQLLDFFAGHKHSKKKLSPFFSIVQSDNEIHRQTIRVMRAGDKRFLETEIPQSVEVERMGIRREPLLKFGSQHGSGQAYWRLCSEVITRLRAA
jgi:chromosome partitioning protein